MNYHNITTDDMLNGDGLRTVLWVAGCEHHCKGCHNMFTWDENGGLPFDKSAETELLNSLGKSYISGVTFSGGDPLMECNRSEVSRLIDVIKENFPEKTIWVYTGYLWDEVKDFSLIQKIDVLVDGEFEVGMMDKNLHWRGSANQRVIDVKATLQMKKIVLHEL